METRGGKKAKFGSQNTRVYAPTHRGEPATAGRDKPPAARTTRAKSVGAISDRPRANGQTARSSGATRTKPAGAISDRPRTNTQNKTSAAGNTRLSRPAQGTTVKQAKLYDDFHRLEPVEKPVKKKAKKPKKQRQPMERKTVLTILISIVVFAGLLCSAYFVFRVDTILVEGNEQYSGSSILALTGLTEGQHMLLANITQAQEAIEDNPYLDVLGIVREWPRTLRVTISERREAAVIAVQDYDVIIDMSGHVLSIGSGKDTSGLIRIAGISQIGFKVNQQLGPGSDMQISALLRILEQLQQWQIVAEITAIDLTNPLQLTINTVDGITVLLGQSERMDEKIYWLVQTLPSLRAGGITTGTLNVNVNGGAVYSPPEAIDTGSQGTQEPDSTDPENPGTTDPEDPDINAPATPDSNDPAPP